MPVGDLVVADWELEYRGLLTGGDNPIALVQIEGLLDLPAVRSADQILLRRHGAHAGDDFADVRQIVLTYELFGETDAELAGLVAQLQAAFRPGGVEEPLVFQLPGVAGGAKAQVWCRPRRRQLPIDLTFHRRLPVAVIELVATDPLLYSAVEQTGSTSLPSASGGHAWPASWPWAWGAVSTGGTIIAINDGAFDADVSFRLDGPVTNPRIESLTAGRTIAWNGTLDVGEFLVLDTKSRTVLLNGTASRYADLDSSSRWFTLAPGSNELAFRASTPSVALLSAAWRSAWL